MSPGLLRRLCLASLGLAAACSSTHWYDYSFSPAPLEIAVVTSADPNAQVRTLVSILGVARAGDGEGDRIEVRMRLENLGTTPVQLHTDNLILCSADLQVFEKPKVFTAAIPVLAAGQSLSVDFAFPLAKDKHPADYNLRGLNLRWDVSFGEQRVTTGATFERSDWRAVYDDSPRVHVGVGVGVGTK
jgi:hypothetical protein